MFLYLAEKSAITLLQLSQVSNSVNSFISPVAFVLFPSELAMSFRIFYSVSVSLK